MGGHIFSNNSVCAYRDKLTNHDIPDHFGARSNHSVVHDRWSTGLPRNRGNAQGNLMKNSAV